MKMTAPMTPPTIPPIAQADNPAGEPVANINRRGKTTVLVAKLINDHCLDLHVGEI